MTEKLKEPGIKREGVSCLVTLNDHFHRKLKYVISLGNSRLVWDIGSNGEPHKAVSLL